MMYMQYLQDEYPREGCGLLGLKNGKQVWIPCANIADDPEKDFLMSHSDYLKGLLTLDEVTFVVHSHTEGDCIPSPNDIRACKFVNIPYKIISIPDGKEFILRPGDIDG